MNTCKTCGRKIPHEPGRRKQPKYCGPCRAHHGRNAQKRLAALAGKKK